MIMCSAQRNKRVKRKKFEAFMMFFFWSLEGSIGHNKKYSIGSETQTDKTLKMSKNWQISHGYRAHCGLPVASFDISFLYWHCLHNEIGRWNRQVWRYLLIITQLNLWLNLPSPGVVEVILAALSRILLSSWQFKDSGLPLWPGQLRWKPTMAPS